MVEFPYRREDVNEKQWSSTLDNGQCMAVIDDSRVIGICNINGKLKTKVDKLE